LTHALQDQNYDLKNWSNPGERRAKAGNKSERFEYDDDEESMARNAVAEGQAMVTLIDYMLQPTGHTLADSPQFGRVMRDAMGKAYEKYDVGSVGEFDVSIILKQFSNDAASGSIARSWRGGSYYAARKAGSSNSTITTGDLAILYLSRWDSDDAAEKFAQVYREGLSTRYKQVGQAQCQPAETCKRSIVSTSEGPVIIEHLANSTVLITEGFEPAVQQQ